MTDDTNDTVVIPAFIPDDWRDRFAQLGYDLTTAKVDEKGVSIGRNERGNPFPITHYFTWESIRGVIHSADKGKVDKEKETNMDIDSMIPSFIPRNWQDRLSEQGYDPASAKVDSESKGVTINKVSPGLPRLPHYFTWERLWKFTLSPEQKAKIDKPYRVPANWLVVLSELGYSMSDSDSEQDHVGDGIHVRKKTGEIEFLSWDSISDMCDKRRQGQGNNQSEFVSVDQSGKESDPCSFHPRGFANWRDCLPPEHTAISTSRRGVVARHDKSGVQGLITWASLRGDDRTGKNKGKLPKDWMEQMAALGYHYGSGSIEGKKKAKFFDESRHKGYDQQGHDLGWEYIFFSSADILRMISDTTFVTKRKEIVCDARQRLDTSQQEQERQQLPEQEESQEQSQQLNLGLEISADAETLLRLANHWRDVQRNIEELSRSLYQLQDFILEQRVNALRAIDAMSERNQGTS
jgi:hypothetical protein